MKIKSAEFIKSGTNTSHMIEGDMPEFMFVDALTLENQASLMLLLIVKL